MGKPIRIYSEIYGIYLFSMLKKQKSQKSATILNVVLFQTSPSKDILAQAKLQVRTKYKPPVPGKLI
jgi:hypothetical protein